MNDYLLRILKSRVAEFMPALILTAVLFFGWFQPAWSQSSSQPEQTDAIAPQHGQPLKPEDSSNGKQPRTGADVSVKPSNVETEKKTRPPATSIKSSRLKEAVPVSGAETQARAELPVRILEQWENRIKALLDDISTGKKEREQVDILYGELISVLLAKHQSLKDAISQRTLNEAIENLHAEVNGLYDMRVRLLQEVTPELRGRITGFDIDGVHELKGEIKHIFLQFRYVLWATPQTTRQHLDELILAPLPTLGKILELVLVLMLFRWWRRWARDGLSRVRKRRLEMQPRKPFDLHFARFLWYVEHVRNPLEWLVLFSVFFNVFNITEVQSILELLWTSIRWVLLAWFMVALIHAMAARGTAGLKSDSSGLRLRSLKLLAVWLLILGLGLAIAEDLSGQGTLYAWIWNLFEFLTLPVLALLVIWWRSEIFRRIEIEPRQPAWVQRMIKHRKGLRSYLSAVAGSIYLILHQFRQWILRRITAFEGGRHLLANLIRREAIRESERQRQMDRGKPIPKDLRNRLLAKDGMIVDSIARKELARLVELADQNQSGAVAIIAERGGGRTSLLQRLALKSEGKAVIFDCPPGGFDAFYQAFASALGVTGTQISSYEIEKRLKESGIRVVGIDNFHRLARPVMGGQKDINRLSELVQGIQVDVLWVLGLDRAAWQYISCIRSEQMVLLEVLELPLWTEEQIRDLIDLRCTEADISPDFGDLVLPRQLDEIDYETIDERNRLGFNRILWNAADGNPAVALQIWVDSLSVSPDGKIIVNIPRFPEIRELEGLNITTLLVLRVITQSGLATQDDILESLRLPIAEVAGAVRFSMQRGWIEEINGRYRLTWKWFRGITRVLSRQNLLPRKSLRGMT
jgi:hypothetical protein